MGIYTNFYAIGYKAVQSTCNIYGKKHKVYDSHCLPMFCFLFFVSQYYKMSPNVLSLVVFLVSLFWKNMAGIVAFHL